MNRHKIRLQLASIAALIMLASACGGGEEVAAGEDYQSPIAEFLGEESFGFGGELSDADKARLVERERQREEAVAACMKEQGFDYTPRDTSEDFNFDFGAESEGLQPGTKEYAEKYGFGISTQRYSQEEVGPDLVGRDDPDVDLGGEDFEDPNQELLDSMDEATRTAYEEALYGSQDDFDLGFDPETMSEEELAEAEEELFENYEPTGCMNTAYNEGSSQKFYTEFSDELEKMYETVLDDPRVTAAYDEINGCLAEKGFEPIDLESGPWDEFETELQEVESLIGPQPFEDMEEADFTAMSDEELDALFNQPRTFSAEAKAKLGEIQEREIGYAVATFECDGNIFEPPAILLEVVTEYENRFLEDNAEQLEEFKGSAAS